MKTIAVLSVLGALASPVVHAQIYRCTDERGQPVFSDRPCSPAAEEVMLDTPEKTGVDMGAGGDFSRVESANAVRATERKVARIEQYIAGLEADHRRKLTSLYSQMDSLTGSKLDTSTRDRIQDEIRSENEAYRTKRRRSMNELSQARAEMTAAAYKNARQD